MRIISSGANATLYISLFVVLNQTKQSQTHGCLFQQFLDLQLVGAHQYSATLLHSHDTETRATMNMALGNGVIAAGQDGTCCVMRYKHCTQRQGNKAAAKDGEAYCHKIN